MKRINEYNVTNKTYGIVLEYIKDKMFDQSGRVVQSYMHCLDSVYNNNHIYMCASFYSEFGEYLIAYTYCRLLSGARLMYVVSDRSKVDGLQKYIQSRLQQYTKTTGDAGWRVRSSEERLDQTDVFIASPEDFKTENIIEHYPGFFEEVSNAIFIDTDRVVSLDSYLCLVMATRLNAATSNRIRYIFLTTDMIRGFAASNLPRFFNVEKVSTFSSADEYEKVSYTLWNRESKNNRIYNKHGQTLTSIDCLIAEEAIKKEYGIDGVRLISNAPMEHADIDNLRKQGVEFNEFYKDMPDVNYMIYSDDHFNLAATLYACTRFRGKKISYANIISRPYLLREYFLFKASSENYITRSAFIQPRVVEHAEHYKLILLKIFAEASQKEGMSLTRFTLKMQNVISDLRMSNESTNYLTKRCAKLIEEYKNGEIALEKIPYQRYIEFIISAFCDDISTPYHKSQAVDIKPYYLIIDPDRVDGYTLVREKSIVFKHVDQVYEKLFECNKRVQLSLNGEIIGTLDTFPTRVRCEYIPGQCFVYKNTEYEIERISSDNNIIFLRRENVRFKNTMDTIFLRKFDIKPMTDDGEIKKYDQIGNLNFSKGNIASITIVPFKASIYRETFGYYSLTSDHQTLNFVKGVIGNTKLTSVVSASNNTKLYPDNNPYAVEFVESKVLKVSIKSRIELNDGVRLLLSTVMNEFVKTIFPTAYHCIAIVPVLKEPIEIKDDLCEFTDQVKSLYPYLYNSNYKDYHESDENFREELTEHDDFQASFYFINDCEEDIGALDWFYDKMGHYVYEFLTNVYSYVYWLSRVPDFSNHYIYFGSDKLPECYDLEKTCELLNSCNVKLSYEGIEDYNTASVDTVDEQLERCAFCHEIMESGRFQLFDDNRYICSNCFNVVTNKDELDVIVREVIDYLNKNYLGEEFGRNIQFELIKPFTVKNYLSENNYVVNYDQRKVQIEMIPRTNICVCVLRALITFWQRDNELNTPYSIAQCYLEEVNYYKSLDKTTTYEWILENIPEDIKNDMADIEDYIANNENSNSFIFIRNLINEDIIDDQIYDEEIDTIDGLYDPLQIPRLWKRFLRGGKLDNGEEEIIGEPIEDPIGNYEINNEDDPEIDPEEQEEPVVVETKNPKPKNKEIPTPKPEPIPEPEPELKLDTDITNEKLSKKDQRKLDKQKKQEYKLYQKLLKEYEKSKKDIDKILIEISKKELKVKDPKFIEKYNNKSKNNQEDDYENKD